MKYLFGVVILLALVACDEGLQDQVEITPLSSNVADYPLQIPASTNAEGESQGDDIDLSAPWFQMAFRGVNNSDQNLHIFAITLTVIGQNRNGSEVRTTIEYTPTVLPFLGDDDESDDINQLGLIPAGGSFDNIVGRGILANGEINLETSTTILFADLDTEVDDLSSLVFAVDAEIEGVFGELPSSPVEPFNQVVRFSVRP